MTRVVTLSIGIVIQLLLLLQLVAISVSGNIPGVPRDTITYVGREAPPPGRHIDPSFECKWRSLAYEYSQKLQPWRGALKFKELYDALQLQTCVNKSSTSNGNNEWNPHTDVLPFVPQHAVPPRVRPMSDAVRTVIGITPSTIVARVFVDAINGSDASNTGSISSPYRTIARALQATRASGPGGFIMLRDGTHYLTSTIQLTQVDNGLTIQSYNGENAIISGGRPLDDIVWKYVGGKANIYAADLSHYNMDDIVGLSVNGARAIRARYPNSFTETDVFPYGWVCGLQETWILPRNLGVSQQINDQTWWRNVSDNYRQFKMGIGGNCSVFTPPASYWCSDGVEGGLDHPPTYMQPQGVKYLTTQLPHAPYSPEVVGRMILQTWRPGHWSTWMALVDRYNGTTREIRWTHGGFQDARGLDEAGEWYVENVREELDNPNEFFYDPKAKQLLYAYNGTGAIPASFKFVVHNLKTFFNISGTQQSPVRAVQFNGITFTQSQYTYMDPHGVPSGGDWALERNAAIFMQGTEDCVIDQCLFTRLDGNAIMLYGYHRATIISKNEFVWLGSTAVAAWGLTKSDDPRVPEGLGLDGTDGNQPRGIILVNNMAHEIGHYQKQSSLWFQAQSCQNTIRNNIAFNLPRAGINFNDGFGGGSEVTENLIFNSCRESGDHGPFNSWDRQVYVTDVLGYPSVTPLPNNIHHNFFVANYNAGAGAVDNDDGSAYYNIHHNFMVYGGAKSDWGGHDKHSYNNVYAFPQVYGEGCWKVIAQSIPMAGHDEGYWNNTCVLTAIGSLYADLPQTCNVTDPSTIHLIAHDNAIYVPGKAMSAHLCNKIYNTADWLSLGWIDQGTQVFDVASADMIISWARPLLGL